MRKKEILPFTTSMDLESIMLINDSECEKTDIWPHLYVKSKMANPIEQRVE